MSKPKRVNPRRMPVSKADVERAKNRTFEDAAKFMFAIAFSVLIDKHGATNEDIDILWQECRDRADAIRRGYATINDYCTALMEENNIKLI